MGKHLKRAGRMKLPILKEPYLFSNGTNGMLMIQVNLHRIKGHPYLGCRILAKGSIQTTTWWVIDPLYPLMI